jgi:hypothetical protein
MDQWIEVVIFSAFASPKGREIALESPLRKTAGSSPILIF